MESHTALRPVISLSEIYRKELETQYGFEIINVETILPIVFMEKMQHAEIIITEYGSVCYTNCLFFNPDADIIFLNTHHRQAYAYYGKVLEALYSKIHVLYPEKKSFMDPLQTLLQKLILTV
jgi:capsular polysaccharide biosynthesis protein